MRSCSHSTATEKIINDILDVFQLESARFDLIISNFNPRYLLEDIVKNFRLHPKSPIWKSDQIPTAILIPYGESVALKQILLSLILIVKFTEPVCEIAWISIQSR
jgi:signal transduction histidine kinase